MSASRTRPRIAYIPADDLTNAYTTRMRELLSAFGHLEKFFFKARLMRLLKGDFRRIDVAFVNWIENELIDRNSGRVSWRGTVKLLIKAVFLKLTARQTVFVRHNLYPHAASAESARTARWLVDRYEELFDMVFIHSGVNIMTAESNRHRSLRASSSLQSGHRRWAPSSAAQLTGTVLPGVRAHCLLTNELKI